MSQKAKTLTSEFAMTVFRMFWEWQKSVRASWRGQVSATSVTLHPLRQAFLGDIWKHTAAITNVSSASKHFMRHSGVNPNHCYQCDNSSFEEGTLKKLLKTHSGEKPNVCSQYYFASARAGSFRAHQLTHNGEQSNKCNQCSYTSFRARSLKNHLKTHSGQISAICVTLHRCAIRLEGTSKNTEKRRKINQM